MEVLKAEEKYNNLPYNLNHIQHELSVCIPIISNPSTISTLPLTIDSVNRQKYLNYKIFVYNLNDHPITEVERNQRVEVVRKEVGRMKECDGFDIVLIVREGEMIGRFVLQRINAVYQNDPLIGMTFSNVLGFDHFYNVPFSKSVLKKEDEKSGISKLAIEGILQ